MSGSSTIAATAEAAAVADLAIIGAGPAGLFACFYAGVRDLSVLLIDSLDVPGGQLATLYPEKYIYDTPGFPRVLAKDLVARLVEQGLQFGPTLHLSEQAERLEWDDATSVFTIGTSRGVRRARAVLITAGVGAFAPKKLPLPGASAYEGAGLSYFVRHVEDFRDRRVLVVGGGDSAVDWANTLAGVASRVTLIHRRDVFRAHEQSLDLLRAGPTRILVFHELDALSGQGRVEEAALLDTRSGAVERLPVDAVLVSIGFESALGPLRHWGIELLGGQIKVDSTMRTSRPGVFAAGDVATYPGKLKLIATAFGEAATAVNYAKNYLDPKAKVFPGHSTNLGLGDRAGRG